jgi:hypothetical protein
MDAKEFIKNELSLFIKQFTKTKASYEYDSSTLVHFVEVVPNEIFRQNSDYINWEEDMYQRFISSFPDQTICFVSDDDPVRVEFPEEFFEGIDYAPYTTGEVVNTYSKVKVVIQSLNYDMITSNIAVPKMEIQFA